MPSIKKGRNPRNHVLMACIFVIGIVAGILFLVPLINAIAGSYSTTSPFSCGTNCNNGYELSGYDEDYCYNNPVDCYNTIDECRDGSNYNFEFVNNIFITSLNGSNFTGGNTINVTVEFDCDTDGDAITISYNNGTGFRVVYNDDCAVSAKVNKSYLVTLDENQGNHSIRAVIVFGGVPNMLCGYDYDTLFSDTDDVTFFVGQGPDTENPLVTIVSPAQGTSYNQSYGLAITISANATDNYEISSVQALVEWDSYNYTVGLNLDESGLYAGSFTNITELTRYNVTIHAYDNSNNLNSTASTYFLVNSTINITLELPTNREIVAYEGMTLKFALQPGYDTDRAMYSIDGEANVIVGEGDKLTVEFAQPDQEEAFGEPDYAYANLSMSFMPSEDMQVEIISISLKRNGSGTANSQLQLRDDDSGTPSGTIIAFGNIINNNVTASYSFVNVTLNTTINLSANTIYWLFITPNGSATDFYTWEASNDGSYASGNYSNNNSLDLLFKAYDKYKYNASITGVEKGYHTIIVYANSTSQNPINSQLIQFTIDNTEPSIGSVGYYPNISALLDPDVPINISASITDELEISEALLQYKKNNESAFTNTTMQNTGGIYTANFTPDSESNWTFRVYARDNSNNIAYSGNVTINTSYEYSWSQAPTSISTVSAFLNTNISVANITINNTADFNFAFNLSKTSSTVPSVYFNSSETSLYFILEAGGSAIIEVKATGQSIESEQEISMITDAINNTANPDSSQLNFTMISFVSGPYLDISITEYDSTVTQGQTRVTLTASIINVGNETANNLTVYWTLPSGWSPKTNVTADYTTLSVGQQVSFSRFIDIDSDASTGNQTIRIDVNCSENKTSYDQKTVEVEGAEEPSPVITRRGGGGGGRAVAIPKTARLDIALAAEGYDAEKSEMEIERGTSQILTGILENTGEEMLKNLSITLKDFPLIHYTANPAQIKELDVNETREFILLINLPEYFDSGKQKTSITVNAQAGNAWKEFKKDFTIIVVTEDKATAMECFGIAEQKIKELQVLYINTDGIHGLLEQARKKYSEREYSSANNLCNEALSQAQQAVQAKESLEAAQQQYIALGKENSAINELIQMGMEAFARGEYELASRRAEEAELLLNTKEKEIQQTATYQWQRLKERLQEIIALTVILSVIIIFAHASTNMKALSKRMNALERHKGQINERVKETQTKYFAKRLIPAKVYEKEMDRHRTVLAGIESKMSELKLKRLKMIGSRKLEDLEKIRKEAEEAKNELQKKYFVEKSVDRKSFKKLSTALHGIIQEIDSKIALKKK